MMVATMAATGPNPNRNSTGTRYANTGTVCMRSSNGVIKRSAARLRNATMPMATPRTTPMGTAMTIEASVTMALSHWPNTAR